MTYVDGNGNAQVIVGGGNDTTLASPTSAVLRGGVLYVTTGGLGAPPPQGFSGGVYAVDVSGYLGGYHGGKEEEDDGWKGKGRGRRWIA